MPKERSNDLPLSSGQDNDTVLGDTNLRWGHNSRGVVYKFDRGVLMYSKTGDKCLRVIPASDKTTHHADLMYQIATDEFNDSIVDTHRPMENARLANEKDMTVLMFEGGLVQIYLPENPTKEVLEDIKRELEPRKDFIIASAINGKILLKTNATIPDAWTYDEYIEYLNNRIKELTPEKQELMELATLTKGQYLTNLVRYIKENNITLKEYFYQLGKKYKENLLDKIATFEKRSPYMTPELISKLLGAKEDRIIEYFGNTMGEMMETELKEMNKPQPLSTEEYIEMLNKYLEEHNLSRKEYFTIVANIYGHGLQGLEDFEKRNPFLDSENIKYLREILPDAKLFNRWIDMQTSIVDFLSPVKMKTADELMGKNIKGIKISQGNNHSNMNITAYDPKTNQQSTISSYNLEDGTYVNFAEYIFSLDETLTEKYPDATNIEMFDKNGQKIRRSDFCYATFDAIKNSSKTIIGDVYKDTFPDDWSEVYYQYRHRKEEQTIGDIDFACGLYVRKEDLDAFVKNYRLKITTAKSLNNDITVNAVKK